MEKKVIKFDADNVDIVDSDEDSRFLTMNIDIASTAPNSHRLIFSKECLEESGKSFYLMPIIGKYDKYTGDVQGHEEKENSYGGFFNKDSIKVVDEPDGYSHLVAKGYLWKNYCSEIVDMLARRKKVSVSMEISICKENEYGAVAEFQAQGCTLLGENVRPSIPTSHAEVISFSEMKNNYDDEKTSYAKLKKFESERKYMEKDKKENFVSHPIDKSKKVLDDGEWDGQKAKQDLVKEKNYNSLAPDVCMVLEDGWKDREVSKLGYPVMNIKDGKWVYNKKGLASALGYAQKENDTAVVSKVEAIYKKLGLDKEEMAKMAEIEGRKAWGEIIEEVQTHEGDGAYVESVEKDHIIFKKDDERYVVKADVEVGKDDKKVHAKIHWDTMKKDADQKMSDDEEKEKTPEEEKKETSEEEKKEEENDKKEEDDKEFSDNANVDSAAQAEYLKREAEYNKILANEFINGDPATMSDEECEKCMSECLTGMSCLSGACADRKFMDDAKFDEVAKKMCGMAENAQKAGAVILAKKQELAKFKDEEERKQTMSAIETVMEEAGCFSDSQKAEYREKAKNVAMADVSALKNEIKAKAFDMKTKAQDENADKSAKFADTRHIGAQIWDSVDRKDSNKIWD